ncbi:hypothetical protein Salat_2034200 [Sesamum alatum]|uniref:DUF4408 domain-containing protein n=1 Tax=Sesamum alatum TaxID=300844 RepID=A0AAE1Y052_9LAMI|nr:hypothetical protein Salat_2034200 [Sesamum alatum]
MEQSNVKTWSKLLLFSVSILSLLLSFSSFMYSQYLSLFSSNYFDLLRTTALNKNYLFLICNGLLVFLAKTSGSDVRSVPDFGPDDVSQKSIRDGPQMGLETDSEATVLETDMAAEESGESEHHEEENDEAGDQSAYCSVAEVSVLTTEDGEEVEENDGHEATDCGLFQDDDDDEEEEEEIEKLSMEELNQKFEDFIRKMKEEIRIGEARQQLVLVN